MALGAVFAVYMLSRLDWAAVSIAVHDLSARVIGLALLATCVSYVGLAGYDVVAVRDLRDIPVSAGRAAAYGAMSYGISNFLGFPWLVGGLVRQRLYDLPASRMGPLVTLVTSGWLAFWLVVAITCGLGMIATGAGFGVVPEGAGRIVGVVLVVLACGCFAALGTGRRFRAFGQRIRLLSRRLTGLQMACAAIDLCASACVLFVLLPQDVAGAFLPFLALFCVAVGFGILSHVPAGIGSFELVIALGLHTSGRSDVGAALLMYRVVRTVLPFVVACAALGLLRREAPVPAVPS